MGGAGVKPCGALVVIVGLPHLGPFRCTREKEHEGHHSITLGKSLTKRLKTPS